MSNPATPELPNFVLADICTARRAGRTQVDTYGDWHPSEGEINEDDLIDVLHEQRFVGRDVRAVYLDYDHVTGGFAIMDADAEATIGSLAVVYGAGA